MAETNPPLFAEERKEKIMQLLSIHSKIHVPHLCETFGVSPVTVRSDLQELEDAGLLKRTHGGAVSLRKAACEPITQIKEVTFKNEKERIALRAAELVESGDTIALDTGTTTFEMAKCLIPKTDLTIITNDLQIALFLKMNLENPTIIVLGGMLHKGFHCTVGPKALQAIENLNVDKVFMATNAFSLEKAFTTPSIEQAEVKEALISIASQVVMLADSSKFGKVSLVRFATLNEIDKIITDTALHPGVATAVCDSAENLELIMV